MRRTGPGDVVGAGVGRVTPHAVVSNTSSSTGTVRAGRAIRMSQPTIRVGGGRALRASRAECRARPRAWLGHNANGPWLNILVSVWSSSEYKAAPRLAPPLLFLAHDWRGRGWGDGAGRGGVNRSVARPQLPENGGNLMKKVLAALMSVAFLGAVTPMADAQSPCPPEVAQAKAMISKVAKSQETQAPRAREIQAPRSLAGARQDVQAPRGQDVQAPRGKQDVQAPRGQDVQAPRGKQDVQAPRGQDVQAPRGKQDVQAPRGQDVQAPRSLAGAKTTGEARKLVREAEAACKAGDMATAKAKAEAAIATLK